VKSATAIVLDALGLAATVLPRPLALGAGRILGRAAYVLIPARRRLALANVTLAYGDELTPRQRRRLVHRMFAHFGQTLVDTLLLPRLVRRGILDYVTHEGWEHLEAAMAKGKGALLFTAHFGNWEIGGLAQSARGIPLDVVGRPPSDPALGRRLEEMRQLTGSRFISKYKAIRPILQSLKEGRSVALVIDQNVSARHPVFVEFFGQPAATTPSLGMLALRTGAPVLPVFVYPEGTRYRSVYDPPLDLPSTGDPERDVAEITAQATRIIEAKIRQHPHLWLWMHNRWQRRLEAPAPGAAMPGTAPRSEGSRFDALPLSATGPGRGGRA
jgi:KDO2-lipid IV(A) lauroyltransferase